MTKIRLHARRTARFLGLSRRSLVALAILGASFALGRLALDAVLPAAAMATQPPSSAATPALASANPIEGGVAAFDDVDAITPAASRAPDFAFNWSNPRLVRNNGADSDFILFKSDQLPALPLSTSAAHSDHKTAAVACGATPDAERSQRIVRLTGDFSRAVGQLARAPGEKQILESLRQARRAAHALRAEHALPTPGTRILPLTPERAAPLSSAAPAVPADEKSSVLPAWLVSLAAWILAGL